MFISEAFAQAPGAPAAGVDPTMAMIMQVAPFALIFVVFYFLMIRPQQRARQQHQQTLNALKRNDIIVTTGGLIGKVKAVADDEVRVELAPNVEVRVVRAMIAEVRSKSDPAPANDTKATAN
jgi:preprotein translocase subunit YajC